MFYPFNYAAARNIRTVDNFGIPVLKTIYVTASSTADTVTYGICPKVWRMLPPEGLFVLNVVNTPPTATPATALVYLDTCRYVDSANSNTTFNNAKSLLNGSGAQMTNEQITSNNRYLIYYNKPCGVFQVINHIVIPTTTT